MPLVTPFKNFTTDFVPGYGTFVKILENMKNMYPNPQVPANLPGDSAPEDFTLGDLAVRSLEESIQQLKSQCLEMQPEPYICQKENSTLHLNCYFGETAEYIWYVKHFLHEAAAHKDEKTFRMILKHIHTIDLLWEYPKSADYYLLQKSMPLHITRDPVFLEILLEKSPLRNKPFGKKIYSFHHKTYFTNAPDIYVNILAGDVEMVRFYLEHGITLSASCSAESIEEDEIERTSEHFGRRSTEDKDFIPDITGYGIQCTYQNSKFRTATGISVFYDPLTAAILSQNIHMIDFIAGYFSQIEWSSPLEESIIYSSKRITNYLLGKFPEILSYIRLSAIIKGLNLVLLQRFLQTHQGERFSLCEEAVRLLDWQSEHNIYEYPCNTYLTGRSLNQKAAFYKELYKADLGDELKSAVRKRVFLESLFQSESQRSVMLELFRQLDINLKDDFTACLNNISVPDRLFSLLKDLGKPFPIAGIDLYTRTKELRSFFDYGITLQNYQLLMTRFVPLRILPETDPFTENIVDRNHPSLIRFAITKGFITPVNGRPLYDYALSQSKCSQETLTMLLEIVNKC